MPRPPVMEDVASLAGVSHQAVSRALNAHLNVTVRTRERRRCCPGRTAPGGS
ncbi:LacI family DNA-binding transcriptional regulator [Arthrobacter sp. D1-17]